MTLPSHAIAPAVPAAAADRVEARLRELELRLARLEAVRVDRLRRMSLEEASGRCGYSVQQLRDLIEDGKMGYTCIGGQYRVSEADLESGLRVFTVRAKEAA